MYRFLLTAIIFTPTCVFAASNACSVQGTAYDIAGKPLSAVVRLMDRQTGAARFSTSDAQTGFAFADLAADETGQRYQIDLLSAPTLVTGSRIPVRSILDIASRFACNAGQTASLNLHAQVR